VCYSCCREKASSKNLIPVVINQKKQLKKSASDDFAGDVMPPQQMALKKLNPKKFIHRRNTIDAVCNDRRQSKCGHAA
jgi:hypothetical protein